MNKYLNRYINRYLIGFMLLNPAANAQQNQIRPCLDQIQNYNKKSSIIYFKHLKTRGTKHLVDIYSDSSLIKTVNQKAIYQVVHVINAEDCSNSLEIQKIDIEFIQVKPGKAVITKLTENQPMNKFDINKIYGVQIKLMHLPNQHIISKNINLIEFGYKSSQLKTNFKQTAKLNGVHLALQFFNLRQKNIFLNIEQLNYQSNSIDLSLLFIGLGIFTPVHSLSFQNWIQGFELSANYQTQANPISTSMFNISLFSKYQFDRSKYLKMNLGTITLNSSDVNFPQNHYGSYLQMNFGYLF